jgi:hypothetical protein
VSLQELEAAVAHLPPADLDAFARWFEEYLADAWDHRIESDILAGRLEEASRRADADFEAGRRTPLDPPQTSSDPPKTFMAIRPDDASAARVM